MEPWDVITYWGLGYLDGTAVKYLARWRHKAGIQDLKKAIHFIEKQIEVEEARRKERPEQLEVKTSHVCVLVGGCPNREECNRSAHCLGRVPPCDYKQAPAPTEAQFNLVCVREEGCKFQRSCSQDGCCYFDLIQKDLSGRPPK